MPNFLTITGGLTYVASSSQCTLIRPGLLGDDLVVRNKTSGGGGA